MYLSISFPRYVYVCMYAFLLDCSSISWNEKEKKKKKKNKVFPFIEFEKEETVNDKSWDN